MLTCSEPSCRSMASLWIRRVRRGGRAIRRLDRRMIQPPVLDQPAQELQMLHVHRLGRLPKHLQIAVEADYVPKAAHVGHDAPWATAARSTSAPIRYASLLLNEARGEALRVPLARERGVKRR